jgi:serine/threonine protein kinase
MEYCFLGDLSLFIRKKGLVGFAQGIDFGDNFQYAGHWGGLDEFVFRYLLGQLACALEFLRLSKIIHRDLKPQVRFYSC